MPTQQDIRQSVLRTALNMAGSAVNATVDGILTATDPLISKLFEDRNILLTDGGTITFTGTQVQFTENLNITVSQKVSGAVPQVISLGSSTQTFTSSGDMLVAVLNRSAGTASVSIVTNGSSLAAVANANQEVFLIAKRVDSGDGTQRLYWRNGFAQNAGQTLRLGQGGGSGSGVGGGSDLNSLQFRAQFIESFTEAATNSASAVNGSAGFTNATYSAAKQMYTANYDASKTATTTGTAVTMSGAPAYTVVAGDVLVNLTTGEVKKITVVTSQTAYTIESAFTSNLAATAVCVSQAVHTKDIYNYSGTGAAISAAFPATTFSEILVDYEDNATSGSNLWTPAVAPFVAFTASTDNSNWTTLQVRATNETDTMQSDICPTAGSSLYIRFFSDKTSGSGFVNLLNYEAFMQKSTSAGNTFNAVWSAYATTNSSTTAVNCTLSVQGGKTTITLTNGNQYPVGVLSGQTVGSLEVLLNGQKLPRFVAGSVPATDAFYTEVSGTVLQLDRDYSSQQLDVQITYSLNTVDSSSANTTQITNTQTFLTTPPVIRSLTTGSGTWNLDYVFYVASCNATAGATYTNNGITYTVYQTVSGATQLIGNGTGAPSLQGILTKASGTGDATISFFTYKAPLWIRVRMAGGGGGGGGSASNGANQMYGGSGGGAGSYIDATIYNPSTGYAYTVGTGGTGGTGGTSGGGGGNGAAGQIVIEQHYVGG